MAIIDNDQRGPRRPIGKPLTELKPCEPTMPDEATSLETAENAEFVREENKNTSDSSGLHATDEAAGVKIKEQLRKGHQLVSRLD